MQSMEQDCALFLLFDVSSLSEIDVTYKTVLSFSILVFVRKKNAINHGSIIES